jgi:hypothetical protein
VKYGPGWIIGNETKEVAMSKRTASRQQLPANVAKALDVLVPRKIFQALQEIKAHRQKLQEEESAAADKIEEIRGLLLKIRRDAYKEIKGQVRQVIDDGTSDTIVAVTVNEFDKVNVPASLKRRVSSFYRKDTIGCGDMFALRRALEKAYPGEFVNVTVDERLFTTTRTEQRIILTKRPEYVKLSLDLKRAKGRLEKAKRMLKDLDERMSLYEYPFAG